jgi:hypothetical protein
VLEPSSEWPDRELPERPIESDALPSWLASTPDVAEPRLPSSCRRKAPPRADHPRPVRLVSCRAVGFKARRTTQWTLLRLQPGQRVLDREFPSITYWEIRDGSVWHQGRRLRRADPDTFEVRVNDYVFVARDENHVFHAWECLPNIDRDTFESLGDSYFRDKNTAYAESETSLRPLKGNRANDFAVLGNGYARDGAYAYYCGTPIRACTQPLSLRLVSSADPMGPCYALDASHVYFEGAALKDADIASWRLVAPGFSRDDQRIYYCAKKLPRADPATWRHLAGASSCDATTVYEMWWPVKGADPGRYSGVSEATRE